jgi:propanol-preferring alcohol dehydrogenase
MLAWAVDRPGPIDQGPLRRIERPVPVPGPGEVRVAVRTCGVCRTDLHLAEGDLPPRRHLVVPGHEVVGVVDRLGPGCQRLRVGDRVGIPWLGRTCGTCRFCASGRENLCVAPTFTGWDADGGYAPLAVVHEDFAHRVPDSLDDVHAAPLLCAGIIGYRALRRSSCPPGGRLGLWGFGGSAHLTAQIALAEGTTVHVRTRATDAQRLAARLGAATVGDVDDPLPEPLDAAILFAPAGSLVPVALAALDRGGILAIAGIHLTDVPPLRYHDHLFDEREVRSVTANTRDDGAELLARAAAIGIQVAATEYPLGHADRALADLAHGRVTGAAVLVVDG